MPLAKNSKINPEQTKPSPSGAEREFYLFYLAITTPSKRKQLYSLYVNSGSK
jgi:hypothetical protein